MRALVCAVPPLVAFAAALLTGRTFAPQIEAHPFVLGREGGEPLTVTRDQPLNLPNVYADARLTATVELPPGTDLDVLARKVRPVLRGGDTPLYHARFVGVRISAGTAAGDGSPARTRSELLFDRRGELGAALTPGVPATLTLEARGNEVSASIAGQGPWTVHATDPFGSFAMLLHERDPVPGTTPADAPAMVIRDLRIDPIGPTRIVPAGIGRFGVWGAMLALGLLVSVVVARAAAGKSITVWAVRSTLGAAALAAGAWVGHTVVLGALLPDTVVTTTGFVAALACGAPLAIAFAGLRGTTLAVGAAVAVAFGAGALEFSAHREAPRLLPLEDPRMDAWFGFGSAAAPFDALAERVHTRRGNVGPRPTPPVQPGHRIAFLGGGETFEMAPDLAYDLGAFATHLVGQQLGTRYEALPMPTLFGNAVQQLRLFRTFYADHSVGLIVLAIPPLDAEAVDEPRPAWDIDPDLGAAPLGSWLLDRLRTAMRRPVPALDRAGLERLLDETDQLAQELGVNVLVLDDVRLPDGWREVLRERATDARWSLAGAEVLRSSPEAAARGLAGYLESSLN